MLRKLLLIVLSVCFLLSVSGCSLLWPTDQTNHPPGQEQPPAGEDPLVRTGSFVPSVIPTVGDDVRLRTVYLLDYQGRYLVPYLLGIPPVEGVAKEVLARLVDSPENRVALSGTDFGLPLPEGTKLLGMTIRDGLAIIDFSPEFLQFRNATHERLAIDSVLYTMTEFPTVDEVEIWVNGHPLTELPSGLAMSYPVSRAQRDLNLEVSPAVTDPSVGAKVRLYFSAVGPSGGLIYFVPVTRIIPNTNEPAAAAVLELIKGPLAISGLLADLPANTELRSVRIEDGTAIVDFSPSLIGYGGGRAAEQALVGALLLTLTELPGVSQVRITINGQVPSLPEGTDLSTPVTRPAVVNPFII